MDGTFLVTCFAAAALIGVVAFAAPNTEVKASTPALESNAEQLQRTAYLCSQHAWPYYQSACVRDHRRPNGRAASVRFVSVDRLLRANAK